MGFKPRQALVTVAGSARGNEGSRGIAASPWKGEAPLSCAALGVIGQVATCYQFFETHHPRIEGDKV